MGLLLCEENGRKRRDFLTAVRTSQFRASEEFGILISSSFTANGYPSSRKKRYVFKD